MESLQLSFQGSPQKFGQAAYCNLYYTESKLYDNVLYKDLIGFKDIWTKKSQVLIFQALYAHLQDILKIKMEQKECIILTQKEEIDFLRRQNHKIMQNNIDRIRKILKEHQISIKKLIEQKEKQVQVIQSQKQLMQQRILQLQKQVEQNQQLINNIGRERQQMATKQKRYEQLSVQRQKKIGDLQTQINRLEKQNRAITTKLNEQKLQLELSLKKTLVQTQQSHKHQIEDLHKNYQSEIQKIHQEKLTSSLQAKNTLNKTIDQYESLLAEIKPKCFNLQQKLKTLQNQLLFQKQHNESLLIDIKKQDDILDKYEGYLKEADQNLISLKQSLTQTQIQLEQSKHTIEKFVIERESFHNRIKICEQEAKRWRQSYYLNKSRIPNILEN